MWKRKRSQVVDVIIAYVDEISKDSNKLWIKKQHHTNNCVTGTIYVQYTRVVESGKEHIWWRWKVRQADKQRRWRREERQTGTVKGKQTYGGREETERMRGKEIESIPRDISASHETFEYPKRHFSIPQDISVKRQTGIDVLTFQRRISSARCKDDGRFTQSSQVSRSIFLVVAAVVK
ncbi:hypothetical protein Pcinc_022030 [Petrolisthes cinctipes]|uniref:Uncharacterized protein n=1 Tax=Petrolisthes cinctipes TaxID=88211 RepID=A0AAE1FEH2_PETCI|nr:hypothetical protein Pcinc_022030 [Petrolisthes cinctipes]